MKTLRWLSVVLLPFALLGLSACGGGAKDNPPVVEVVPDKKTSSADTKDSKTVPVTEVEKGTSLSPWGIFGNMEVPAKSTINYGEDGIEIASGGNFNLVLQFGEVDLVQRKKELASARPGLSFREARDSLIWETKDAKGTRGGLEASVRLGTTGLRVTSLGEGYASADLDQMLTAIRTLTQTETSKQKEETQLANIAALQKSGLKLLRTPSGWQIEIEGSARNDEAVRPLREMVGVDTITLTRTPGITATGMVDILSAAGLRDLRILECPFDDNRFAPISTSVNLRKLAIDKADLTDEGLSFLKNLKNLRELAITRTRITDNGLHQFSGLESLVAVILDNNSIRGGSLGYFKSLTNLRQVSLCGTGLKDVACDNLRDLPLQTIFCDFSEISDRGLLALKSMTTLENLSVTYSQVTAEGLKALSTQKKLKFLRLEGCDIAGGLEHLKDCEELQTLDLSNTLLNDASLEKLPTLPKLTELNLAQTFITDATLTRLAAVPSLQGINVSETDVTFATVAKLRQSSKKQIGFQAPEPEVRTVTPPTPTADLKPAKPDELLKRLKAEIKYPGDDITKPAMSIKIFSEELTDLDLADLRDLKTLKVLEIRSQKVTDAGLVYLSGLTELEELALRGTSIKGDGLVLLKTLKKLTKLALPNTPFTATQLAPIAELKGLDSLSVLLAGGNTDAKLKVLSELPALKSIDLTGILITNRMCVHLAKIQGLESLKLLGNFTRRGLTALKDLPRLTDLRVDCPLLSDNELSLFGEFKALESLHLRGFPLSDSGVYLLRNIRKLKQLSLRSPKITDRSMSAIHDLSELVELELNEAQITVKGVASLEGMKDLESVDLSDTPLTDADLAPLAKLEELRSLKLDRTKVTGTGLEPLQKLDRLRGLSLGGCPLSEAGLRTISQLPAVVRLELRSTTLTGKGIEELRSLKTLEVLSLENSMNIPDEVIQAVGKLTQVKELSLINSTLTEAALAELKKVRPGLKMVR